jgi:hypothetical protein
MAGQSKKIAAERCVYIFLSPSIVTTLLHRVKLSAHVLCCPLQVPPFRHYTISFVTVFNLFTAE